MYIYIYVYTHMYMCDMYMYMHICKYTLIHNYIYLHSGEQRPCWQKPCWQIYAHGLHGYLGASARVAPVRKRH